MKFKKQAVVMALAAVMAMPYLSSQAADATATHGGHGAHSMDRMVQMHSEKVQKIMANQQSIMSAVWYQDSVEAKALYIQAYNVAREQLNKDLMQKSEKPRAIILDIDETVLDNSPQEAFYFVGTHSYPEGWNEWVHAAEAKPVPGAKDFLQYAASKGVEAFYVSDRKEAQLADTINNLKKEGLPYADAAHVLLKKAGMKSKESRRQQVAKDYNVIMLFGDNILDFEALEGLTPAQREVKLQEMAPKFGVKYFILPNPMYGSWEAALYDYNFKKSAAEKMKLRQDALHVFDYRQVKAQK